MYSYNETRHAITIQSYDTCDKSSANARLYEAPAIIIDPNSVKCYANYSPDRGYSSPLPASEITPFCTVATICGQPPKYPGIFVPLNCAFHSEVIAVQRPFEEYCDSWKLYHIETFCHRTTLRLVHVPSLKKDTRIIIKLRIDHSSIAYQCRIQFPSKLQYKCELYNCIFRSRDIPSGHTPIEVGIRHFTNYPDRRKCSSERNCAYTIQDSLT